MSGLGTLRLCVWVCVSVWECVWVSKPKNCYRQRKKNSLKNKQDQDISILLDKPGRWHFNWDAHDDAMETLLVFIHTRREGERKYSIFPFTGLDCIVHRKISLTQHRPLPFMRLQFGHKGDRQQSDRTAQVKAVSTLESDPVFASDSTLSPGLTQTRYQNEMLPIRDPFNYL